MKLKQHVGKSSYDILGEKGSFKIIDENVKKENRLIAGSVQFKKQFR